MNQKILVPLDGTTLAENALFKAIELAQLLNAELVLLRVCKVSARSKTGYINSNKAEFIKNAEYYLAKLRETLTNPSLPGSLPPERVKIMLQQGDPARAIINTTASEEADLIVMTTHARNGIPRLLLGSVASRVVREANRPVLLLRPNTFQKPELSGQGVNAATEEVRRVVVSLDGTAEAEAALQPALEIAQQLGATLYLLRVEQPFAPVNYDRMMGDYGFYYGSELVALNKQRREEAYQYLDRIQSLVSGSGLNFVKVVRVGEPAEEIVNYLNKTPVEMLVMATRSRNKLGEFFLGSVSTEVLHRSNSPILLVHTYLQANSARLSHEAKAYQRLVS